MCEKGCWCDWGLGAAFGSSWWTAKPAGQHCDEEWGRGGCRGGSEGAGAGCPSAAARVVLDGGACCAWPAQTNQHPPEVLGKHSNLSLSHPHRSSVHKAGLEIPSCCTKGSWALQGRRMVMVASLQVNHRGGRLSRWGWRGNTEGAVFRYISLSASNTFSDA